MLRFAQLITAIKGLKEALRVRSYVYLFYFDGKMQDLTLLFLRPDHTVPRPIKEEGRDKFGNRAL